MIERHKDFGHSERGASMADQTATIVTENETAEAFFADRERFWHAFMGFAAGAVVVVVIGMILMGFFLL
jgi:hypothetical protein